MHAVNKHVLEVEKEQWKGMERGTKPMMAGTNENNTINTIGKWD